MESISQQFHNKAAFPMMGHALEIKALFRIFVTSINGYQYR